MTWDRVYGGMPVWAWALVGGVGLLWLRTRQLAAAPAYAAQTGTGIPIGPEYDAPPSDTGALALETITLSPSQFRIRRPSGTAIGSPPIDAAYGVPPTRSTGPAAAYGASAVTAGTSQPWAQINPMYNPVFGG